MQPIDLTQNRLKELKLTGIRLGLEARIQEAQKEQYGFHQFLGFCLEDEVVYRKQEKVVRLIRSAGFKAQASCENIDYTVKRNLDRKQVQDLSTCRFISSGLNILIIGPTGVGKSHLATAIGNSACRNGFSTLFCRMNTLMEKLAISRSEGSYLNYGKRLSQVGF
jgi:DNA replication protein DnaC